MQIDAEEIQKVAQDIFVREKINLAIVGPVDPGRGEKLKSLLKL